MASGRLPLIFFFQLGNGVDHFIDNIIQFLFGHSQKFHHTGFQFGLCSIAAGGYGAGRTDLDYGKRDLFEAQMGEFVGAVRAGRQPSRSTLNDSVLLMEAMDMIKKEIDR